MRVKNHLIAATVAAGCSMVLGLAPAAGAAAATPKARATPRPPAQMSAVGGARLGRPGVQLGDDAPTLPNGISSLSWMVSDPDTGQVLAADNVHWRLPPASTLKTLFADTVLPRFPATATHKVTNQDLAGMGEGSSLVGVLPGHTYKVSDLWLGVFLRSGNDAVHTLASMNGGVARTVADMQAEAKKLGADDTHVVTPDGYDEPGQVSSAYDLSLFARQGLRNADFARYCSTARAEFPGGPNTKNKPFEIDNTNRLLSGVYGVRPYPGVVGVKNGYTTNAGNTLIVAARRNGHTVMATLMHPENPRSDEVYAEARALLDWGFQADGKAEPVGSLDAAATPGSQVSHPTSADAAQTAAKVSGTGGVGALGWAGIIAAAVVLVAGASAFALRHGRPSGRRRF
ncbi:D-alanyl-D-alanine carboxypeptidase family protein [Phaeacidiphilus oryzae]|uniref:D-alanyl-D-alanine carboxypeptidase family protein n=1 Tax=Phaeacidiphilus oryzae TaxID=348818 RepID=UPI0007C6BBCC|nr:D-alanyl-D-alanine carboxypeptidase [Phaeacidiphilus oryzae]